MRYLNIHGKRNILIAVIGLVVLLTLFCGCGGGNPRGTHYYTSTPTVNTSEANPELTSTLTSPTRTQNQPINVTIDYLGIKCIYQPAIYLAPNKIQLYIVVDDGKDIKQFAYPSNEQGIVMDDFKLEDLGQQIIFETSSVGSYLRISALAYSCEDKDTVLAILEALRAFEPSAGTIKEFYQMLPQREELIGWYESTWQPSQNWGTTQGKYEAVGSGDLRLWFRIWSDDEPEAIAKTNFGPDVRIVDVVLPSDAKKRGPLETIFVNTYPSTLSIQNNEAIDVEVYVSIKGQGRCLDIMGFTGGAITIPGYGHRDITTKYYYETAGIRQITYTILYKGTELDIWSRTLNVVP